MKSYSHRSFTRTVVLAASVLLCGGPALLRAQETPDATAAQLDESVGRQGADKAAGELSAKFTDFAGSKENADALVAGLSGGTTIKLTATVDSQPVVTEFQPATTKLGYGNTFISLALAQESLTQAGITNPTPAQIVAALNGGTIKGGAGTDVTLSGVLALRATGQGWGEIAQSLGVKLGPVISDLHSVNQRVDHPVRPAVSAKPERAPRIDTPARVDGAPHSNVARPPSPAPRPMTPPGQLVRPGKP